MTVRYGESAMIFSRTSFEVSPGADRRTPAGAVRFGPAVGTR
jgi:hypothetical protein